MGAAGRAAQDCEWYGTNVSMIDGWAVKDCEWLYECLHDWFLEPKQDNTCIRWLLVRNSNYHVFAILYLVFLKEFWPCWLQQVLLVDLWLLIHLNYLFGTTNPIMLYSPVVNSLKVNFIEWRKMSVIYIITYYNMNECCCSFFFVAQQGHLYAWWSSQTRNWNLEIFTEISVIQIKNSFISAKVCLCWC